MVQRTLVEEGGGMNIQLSKGGISFVENVVAADNVHKVELFIVVIMH